MKTKPTINTLIVSIFIAIAAMFTSCSVSNQLSQNPHYHLNLVKANIHPLPSGKKENDNTTADIAPLSHHSSLVSYQSDEQINELTGLLKTDMKLLTKETKKSSPAMYQQIKALNLNKTLNQITKANSKVSTNNKSSVNKTTMDGGGGRYLGLWLTFLIIALVFFILTLAIPILYIFGLISILAAAIFFILWIVSLA